MLFGESAAERRSARATCQAYLASIFPWAFGQAIATGTQEDTPELAPVERNGVVYTLPAWTYVSQEFFELEADTIFRSSWQVVGHVNQIPKPGDYLTFNLLSERALVIRGKDDRIRGFHNVCAHRAHAVVRGPGGHCKGFLQCPYHGWTYQLDGACRAVAMPDSFDSIEKQKLGLKPVDIEIFLGFIFIRFESRGPSVAERMAPYLDELSHYRFDKMLPSGELWEEVHDIDWKNVVDNYVEDYHFPTGHPGLSALMQREYQREALPSGVMRLSHLMRDKPLKGWSVERYHQVLPEFEHLPDDMRKRWSYFGLFPSVFFDCYPESMDFFQVLPIGPGKVRLRSQTYTLPGGPRETQAAEFLSTRINTQVQAEDNDLTRSVQQGLKSSAYQLGILSKKEVVVRGFHDWIRAQLPASRLLRAPPPGTATEINKRLSGSGEHSGQRRTGP
jgi:phenylpropionate dioxygenase-like ring-hydroxylating dioxygenase large terminal subunit